jgi:hypothetical protein
VRLIVKAGRESGGAILTCRGGVGARNGLTSCWRI